MNNTFNARLRTRWAYISQITEGRGPSLEVFQTLTVGFNGGKTTLSMVEKEKADSISTSNKVYIHLILYKPHHCLPSAQAIHLSWHRGDSVSNRCATWVMVPLDNILFLFASNSMTKPIQSELMAEHTSERRLTHFLARSCPSRYCTGICHSRSKGKKKKNPEERIQLRWEGVVERGLREGSLDQMMHYNSLTHLSSRDCSLDRLGGPGFWGDSEKEQGVG